MHLKMSSGKCRPLCLSQNVLIGLNCLSFACRQSITWTNAEWLIVNWNLRNIVHWNSNQNTTIFIQESALRNDIFVNWNLRNKLQWNSNLNTNIFFQESALKNVILRMFVILFRPQKWVFTISLCLHGSLRDLPPLWYINKARHPGGHYWDYYDDALSVRQVTATHLMIGDP